jgi:hypothetical protein
MNKPDRARTLLGDEFFTGEIDSIKASLISVITNSSEHDIDTRERAYLKLRLLDEIIGHFSSIAAETELVKRRWKIL